MVWIPGGPSTESLTRRTLPSGNMGEELVRRLAKAGFTVIVKLHDRSRDTQFVHSGGVDWGERLKPTLKEVGGHLLLRLNASRSELKRAKGRDRQVQGAPHVV